MKIKKLTNGNCKTDEQNWISATVHFVIIMSWAKSEIGCLIPFVNLIYIYRYMREKKK